MATARQREVTEALAAEIRSLAGRRNLKSFGLSRLTGIPKSTMANIWNGQTAIDVDQIAAIAQALDVDPGQLLVTAIANSTRVPPSPDPDIHPEDERLIDGSDKLTKRQRDGLKATLRGDIQGDRQVSSESNPGESVTSSARRRGRAGAG